MAAKQNESQPDAVAEARQAEKPDALVGIDAQREPDADRAEANRPDATVPGGRYLVGDTLVDANGEPLKEADSDKS